MEIHNVDDLKKAMEESEGYMVGVTLLNKGKLEHFFFTNNFPYLDFLRSLKHIKDLAVQQLEKESELPEF